MLSNLFTVWLLHFAVLLSPGVNTLLLSQIAASGQTRQVRFVVLGIATATMVWASAALLGLHALLTTLPELRQSLQLVGGCYLLYVAWRLWCSGGAASNTAAFTAHTPWAAYRLGFLVNITNPKGGVFFATVFTTVLPASPDLWIQLSAGLVVVANSLVWHLFLAALFGNVRVQSAYGRARGWVNRLAAGIVGALGLHLLLAVVREARRG